MPDYLDNIINLSWVQAVLEKIYNLNPEEIWILIFIAAVLILFLAYRTLGMKMVFVLMLVYLIIYVLYINDIFGSYEKRVIDNEKHMKTIENELEKNN